MKVWCVHIVIYIGVFTSLNAQSLEDLLLTTHKIQKSTQHLLQFPKKSKISKLDFLYKKNDSTSLISQQIQLKELEAISKRKDYGLYIKASANKNIGNIIDEETNINLRARARMELELKLLKEGFFSNKQKARVFENEKTQLQLQKNKEALKLWRRSFKAQTTYSIQNELKELLIQKKKFMDQYYEVVQSLYSKKYIGRELLIQLGHQIYISENRIQGIDEHNQQIKDSSFVALPIEKLPLIEVDHFIKENSVPLDSIQILEIDRLALQSHWTKNWNLSVYVNQNWIEQNFNDRHYTSIGVRFSAPLKKSYQKSLLKQQQKVVLAQFKNKRQGITNQWIVQFSEYQEKVKDLHQQFKNWQVVQEKLRVLQVLKDEITPYQHGLQQLELQLIQFEILENTLALKLQLYNAISHLKVMQPSIKYIPFEFKQLPEQQTIIIIDNNVFDYQLQFEFLKARAISKVYLSKPTPKLKQLCDNYNIEIVDHVEERFIRLEHWINEELKNLSQPNHEKI